jgi:hypothetical protein
MSGEECMSVSTLESWYASQCNGEWEHSYGIRIDTLDNPGWSVQIDLRDTRRQGGVLEKKKIDRTETDWVLCWTEKQQFRIACGPLNLSEAAEIFVRWFDSESG